MEEEAKKEESESKNADETKPEKDDAEKLELYRFVHSSSEVALKSEMTRKSQILDQLRTIQTVFFNSVRRAVFRCAAPSA